MKSIFIALAICVLSGCLSPGGSQPSSDGSAPHDNLQTCDGPDNGAGNSCAQSVMPDTY